jgi:DNA primase
MLAVGAIGIVGGRCETGTPLAEDRAALTRQVKEASDIVAVVGSYLALQRSGRIFKAVCPFHSDTRPSLQVDPQYQNYRCWSCGKKGDVFEFVKEMEKVDFLEARQILARRAGISLEGETGPNLARLKLLDAMHWAEQTYRECLIDSPIGEQARVYLGDRRLNGATVRDFGLGFAPLAGDWLLQRARQERQDCETLQEIGLLSEREERKGFYDRFRDRVMFPIRDVRGQTVGFGGRILPASPYATRSPKYYNSTETPLFKKSELLYGLDRARHAGASEGYLAVVEGYTDVLMAHQHGVANVVATMGTALNANHVYQLRRYVPRVVLVFDADEGGASGVDRALEIFVSQDVELSVAVLPEGLDPCDMLVSQGAESFKLALKNAVDALDFKIDLLVRRDDYRGINGTKRLVDAILGILALAPEISGKAGQVKRDLILNRLAHRLGLRLETIWARFGELREGRKKDSSSRIVGEAAQADPPAASGPAPPLERQLLELVLADPALVPQAAREVQPDELSHPGLRKLLAGLYQLRAAGEPPELDGLRGIIANPALITWALDHREIGRMIPDRQDWMRKVLDSFRGRREAEGQGMLKDRLHAAADHDAAIDLLRQLQQRQRFLDSTGDTLTG